MSSHSPVTLIKHNNRKIKYFEMKNGAANCYDLPKYPTIRKLSTNIIEYSEQEQLLSIINRINIEQKPVFFTEGHTDPIILTHAWKKLYDEDMPFIPFYAFSCNQLYGLLTDDKIVNEMDGLPLFGMFDFDKAFAQWNGIKGEDIETDPFKGLIRKRNNHEVYAVMLPVPQNESIKVQVIKDESATFKDESCCEIEHLFYGSEKTEMYFKTEPCRGGGQQIVFKSDGDKTKFAQEIVPKVEDPYFQIFRPLFEFVKTKC